VGQRLTQERALEQLHGAMMEVGLGETGEFPPGRGRDRGEGIIRVRPRSIPEDKLSNCLSRG